MPSTAREFWLQLTIPARETVLANIGLKYISVEEYRLMNWESLPVAIQSFVTDYFNTLNT